MTVRIIGGNLRDLSYIAANLRPEDHAEVDCQFSEWTPAQLALTAMQGFAYVAELDGNPEAAFGAGELRSGLWIIWSWGSRRIPRCVPLITKFCKEVVMPDVLAAGAYRGEARALASNDMAQRWLARLGATRRCLLPAYGKNGEDFVLWDWTRESFAQPTPAIGGSHLLHVKTTGTEAPATDADGAGQGRAGSRRSAPGSVESQ